MAETRRGEVYRGEIQIGDHRNPNDPPDPRGADPRGADPPGPDPRPGPDLDPHIERDPNVPTPDPIAGDADPVIAATPSLPFDPKPQGEPSPSGGVVVSAPAATLAEQIEHDIAATIERLETRDRVLIPDVPSLTDRHLDESWHGTAVTLADLGNVDPDAEKALRNTHSAIEDLLSEWEKRRRAVDEAPDPLDDLAHKVSRTLLEFAAEANELAIKKGLDPHARDRFLESVLGHVEAIRRQVEELHENSFASSIVKLEDTGSVPPALAEEIRRHSGELDAFWSASKIDLGSRLETKLFSKLDKAFGKALGDKLGQWGKVIGKSDRASGKRLIALTDEITAILGRYKEKSGALLKEGHRDVAQELAQRLDAIAREMARQLRARRA